MSDSSTSSPRGIGDAVSVNNTSDEITVVHLMRHGEVHNPDGVLYGRRPGYHLSELGRQMADRVAEHLASRDITHVVASPLERAQETATPVAKSHGLELASDVRLIEAANIFEGKTFGVGDGALSRPANWKHLTNPFRPSWGEPYVDQVVRMMGALNAARDAARGHEAVCVSHQLAHLDRTELRGAAAALARPAQAAVHARLADDVHVPGGPDYLCRIHGTGEGPGAVPPPVGRKARQRKSKSIWCLE